MEGYDWVVVDQAYVYNEHWDEVFGRYQSKEEADRAALEFDQLVVEYRPVV